VIQQSQKRNVPDLVWRVSQNYQEYTAMDEIGKRYIGLDVHKHYLIALGVDQNLEVVMPARRVELSNLESWMRKTLTKQDEVVLEMTTNTWQLYDELVEYAGSVTVVHPPHVALTPRLRWVQVSRAHKS
jgi:hypothetical protein